ncbi:hypothetical protein WDJ50_18545 (plasmid) [Deinococcus sp. VB142]|uniref:Uncharacterized protein n=1 Tax=Deinococcus sp. VB142 TaxID=3112952 RepID=A0AAU6Q957_9DEIO
MSGPDDIGLELGHISDEQRRENVRLTVEAERPHIWTATLCAEVRSKGTPGKPKIEHQVYTVELPADPEHPDDPTITLAHEYGTSIYLDKWCATEFDPVARTSVFRRTFRASDKLFQRLELYGWKRRKDLETEAQP